MKAAVCRSFGAPLEIEEVDLAPPGAADVEVELAACAICHSDVSYAAGEWGGVLPAVYGHEAAGTVIARGDEVTGIAVGDRVVVTLIRSCGSCRYCTTGASVLCETELALDRRSPLSVRGTPLHQAMRTGGFAERVVVHGSQVAVVPPELPFDEAALLACGVLTGVGAVVNASSVGTGSAVVVIGCGGVGLNAVQGAALAGAPTIVAADLDPAKRAVAGRFGATDALDPAGADAADRLRAVTSGGPSHVFVATGAPAALRAGLEYLAPGGELVIIGMPPAGVTIDLDPTALASAGQKVIGTKMGAGQLDRDIPRLVELWAGGRLELGALITGRYRLEGINEAIADLAAGGAIRNVIVFD